MLIDGHPSASGHFRTHQPMNEVEGRTRQIRAFTSADATDAMFHQGHPQVNNRRDPTST